MEEKIHSTKLKRPAAAGSCSRLDAGGRTGRGGAAPHPHKVHRHFFGHSGGHGGKQLLIRNANPVDGGECGVGAAQRQVEDQVEGLHAGLNAGAQ